MSTDQDSELDEKRVYAAKTGRTTVYLATGAGLARVSVSGDLVGEFGLKHPGKVTDVAAANDALAVATPDDVLLANGEEFVATGFGPADAIDFHDGVAVAAGGGRIGRFDGGGWETTVELEDVRALTGGLAAAASGVHRLDGTHVGLADARDVAVGRAVYAATADGLYWLANGWRAAVEGPVSAVACAADGRAYASTVAGCYACGEADDDWTLVDLPVEGHVVDAAYTDDATYLATADGRFLASAGDGWRERVLGVADVRAMACP